MKKTKRIFAIVAILILVLLYGSTLFFALFEPAKSMVFFKASIGCTILFPVLLYTMLLFYRLLKKENDDKDHPSAQ